MSASHRAYGSGVVEEEVVIEACSDDIVERRTVWIQVGIGYTESEDACTKTSIRLTTPQSIAYGTALLMHKSLQQ